MKTFGNIFLLLLLGVALVEDCALARQTQHTKQIRVSKAVKAAAQQDIEEQCVGKALDLVFVIDSSRSILPPDFERVKEFINNILKFLDIGADKTRVGLVLYGSTVDSVFALNTHRKVADMMEAVKNMVHLATGTMTGLAIEYTMKVAFSTREGARPLNRNVPRVAIIVTDGRPQDKVAEVAAQARDAGILIFAVGVGRVDMETLRLIGSEPHEKHVFFVQNFSMIQTLLSEFQTKICDTDLCGVTGHGCEQICISTPGSYICKCKKGYVLNSDQKTCSRVDFCVLAGNRCEHDCVSTEDSYFCKCRKGYILNPDGKTCQRCANGAMDLVFFIDGSGSLGAKNFHSVKPFVSSIVDGLEVASNTTRVGLVQYSTKAQTEFPLRRYGTANELKAAVRQVKYIGRAPKAGLAPRQIFKNSFKVAEGARPLSQKIPKIAIVFTAGRDQVDMAEWANKAKQNVEDNLLRFVDIEGEIIVADRSREGAVLESVGTRPQTFVSFSRWKKVEERTSSVRGVLDYAGCFIKTAGSVDKGINIYAVGVGKAAQEELKQIASFPHDEYLYYTKDFKTMGKIMEKLKLQICKGSPSLDDQCKCEAVVSFHVNANERIQTLSQKLDEVMNRLKIMENYFKAK